MTLELKLRKVGNSLGFVLPKEALVHLGLNKEGDSLILTQTRDGLRLTAANRDFAETMSAFESLIRRYRNTLRKLAE